MHINIPTGEFPPNVPPKLIKFFIQENRSYGRLAKRLSRPEKPMNKSYLHNLITKGIEPTNLDIRVRLFLPRKYRKPILKWVDQATAFLKAAEEKENTPSRLIYKRGGKY